MEARTAGRPGFARRLTTETKQAFKTTEFWAYVLVLLGVLIAGLVVGEEEGTESDFFTADEVWLLAVILTVGYMISRGLAKAGSRDPYWDSPSSGDEGGGLGERVKTAAQVLKEGEGAARGTEGAPGGTSGRTTPGGMNY